MLSASSRFEAIGFKYTLPPIISLNKTAFLIVVNQNEMQAYLDMITDKLGIPRVERYFHISVANLTGNPADSIGDINKGDVYDE